jgi:hypothetical protein
MLAGFGPMRVFLDFEASSLSRQSYPIEVGWAGEDASQEEHLIRPAEGWTDWDASAEAIHGISRETLETRGEAHDQVARRLLETLGVHDVYVTAPSWDGMWLSRLLRGAGLPRHAMRLKEAEEAHIGAALDALGAGPDDPHALLAAVDFLAQARGALAARPPVHRALADAMLERDVFFEVLRLAKARRAADDRS